MPRSLGEKQIAHRDISLQEKPDNEIRDRLSNVRGECNQLVSTVLIDPREQIADGVGRAF
jgi:hypothetical protein